MESAIGHGFLSATDWELRFDWISICGVLCWGISVGSVGFLCLVVLDRDLLAVAASDQDEIQSALGAAANHSSSFVEF